jgi:membrane protein YqaA with SNARE-associated domain
MDNYLMRKVIDLSFNFVRRFYDWMLHWSKTKNSNYALFCVAFLGSSILPISSSILLIPMAVSEPKNWHRIALICTVGSVLGALPGYYIGKILYDTIGISIVNFYNLHHSMSVLSEKYANNAFLSIFAGAFIPVPYKAITISAGVFGISLPVLIIASLIGRGMKFFIIAGSIRIFGKKVQYVIEKYFNIFSLIFFIILISGVLFFKYLI